MPCNNEGGSSMSVDQVQLNWPTELAVSPLDGSLHIVDDNVVLKVGNDGLVRVVAGRPLHCPPPPKGGGQGQPEGEPMWATSTSLASPQSIAFAPNGDLYVAESDSQRINRSLTQLHYFSLLTIKDQICLQTQNEPLRLAGHK